MSNELPTSQPEETLPEIKPEPRDWFLALLVSAVNKYSSDGHIVSFNVTLCVGGTLITGDLISQQAYFDKLATLVNQSTPPVNGEEVNDVLGLQHIADTLRSSDAERPADGLALPPAVYIHLDKAQVQTPGNLPMPQGGMIWRGRLDAVDGFTIGSF